MKIMVANLQLLLKSALVQVDVLTMAQINFIKNPNYEVLYTSEIEMKHLFV